MCLFETDQEAKFNSYIDLVKSTKCDKFIMSDLFDVDEESEDFGRKYALLINDIKFLPDIENMQILSNNSKLHIFFDDLMGCILRNNIFTRLFSRKLNKKINTFWFVFDIHQMFDIDLPKVNNEPESLLKHEDNITFEIIHLNTIYRYTKEIYDIMKLFYNYSLHLKANQVKNSIRVLEYFDCFCKFYSEIEKKKI
jgi:hypothetical protein